MNRAAIDSMTVDTTGIDAQLAVVLSYNGTSFAGFARQPGQHTVQGDIEHALGLALRRPVEVVCAGRTDAGVHARGQVVSFPITQEELGERNLFKLKRSLQALTDDAITIQTLSVMPPDFSARFSAIEREYRYLLMPGGRHPLFLRDWCWDVRRELDVDAMNEAASLLVGEHDFKSFCLAASAEGKNTVRTLHDVHVVPVNVLGEEALSVRVTGTAFLHSMVRSIVGTLVMVGAGLRPPAWVAEVLEARNRQAAGENAPACGLVFWRVGYRGGVPCYERDLLEASSDLAARAGAGGVKELYSSGGACKQAPILAENAPLAHFPGARIMLKQSSLGEMPTGHFSRCGTARGIPSPGGPGDGNSLAFLEHDVALRTGSGFRTRVGIKVQDGCNNACTYCIVHVARGESWSVPFEEVVAEARAHALAGVRELVLTGINLGAYDDGGRTLADLLEALLEACPGARFRIGSVEPLDVSDELISLMAASDGRVCRHLHLPLQSGSSRVLSEMARPYDAAYFLSLVEKLRAAMPALSLSTDIIVGFPGETDEDFAETLGVASASAFSKIHVFRYSRREGTPAAERDDQVAATIVAERSRKLQALGLELGREDAKHRLGTDESVLVERVGQGTTESYHPVRWTSSAPAVGELVRIHLESLGRDGAFIV